MMFGQQVSVLLPEIVTWPLPFHCVVRIISTSPQPARLNCIVWPQGRHGTAWGRCMWRLGVFGRSGARIVSIPRLVVTSRLVTLLRAHNIYFKFFILICKVIITCAIESAPLWTTALTSFWTWSSRVSCKWAIALSRSRWSTDPTENLDGICWCCRSGTTRRRSRSMFRMDSESLLLVSLAMDESVFLEARLSSEE